MTSPRPFTLPRFVRPLPLGTPDESPERDAGVDALGFLLDPSRGACRGSGADVVPLTQIDDTRCAVLLGEPGMGKSVAL